MGYASALLAKDTSAEQANLQKQAKKRGLLGSIGRMVGSFAPMMFGPMGWAAKAAISGLGSLAGGAALSSTVGIDEGKFFKADRKTIQRETDPFGAENITGAIKTGLTAGLGSKLSDAAGLTTPTVADKAGVPDKAGLFTKEAWKLPETLPQINPVPQSPQPDFFPDLPMERVKRTPILPYKTGDTGSLFGG